MEIFNRLHAAHGGADNIKHKGRDVMCWANMVSDIAVYAKSCEVPKRHKSIIPSFYR